VQNARAYSERVKLTRPSNGDVVAGISVALVAIPQALAYAELAGLPARVGLYAVVLPALLAAGLMSSRYLQTGPVALTALLVLGALSPLAAEQSDEYIQMAALLALMVGVIRLVLGLVQFGQIAYLLSEPVLTGFTVAAALLIFFSQMPRLVDYDPGDVGVLRGVFEELTHPRDWKLSAILFSVFTAAVLIGGRRIHALFPGVLVAVIAADIISSLIGYEGFTVDNLDGDFIAFNFSFPWDRFVDLIVPALVIALVGFAEPAAIARTYAAEERQQWNANREMVSQGVANLASAFSGAFPVGGSFSRSAIAKTAGGTSQWTGAISAIFVLIALPFTPLLNNLPKAVLGTIVIVSVFKLLKFRDMAVLFRDSRAQAWVAVGTFAATIAFSPRLQYGVVTGIGLSLVAHLYRELTVTAPSSQEGNVLTVSPQGVLWFATVPLVDRLIRDELAKHDDISEVVLDLSGVGRLDYSGGAAISRLREELRSTGITFTTTRVNPAAQRSVSVHLE
jgi:SulP family sulfate permease